MLDGTKLPYRLADVGEAIAYMQRGEARVQLYSRISNNRYDYYIKENKTGRAFHVYLVSKSNELAYLGEIRDGAFQRGTYTKVHEKAPAYLAFVWMWGNLCAYSIPNGVEVIAIG